MDRKVVKMEKKAEEERNEEEGEEQKRRKREFSATTAYNPYLYIFLMRSRK